MAQSDTMPNAALNTAVRGARNITTTITGDVVGEGVNALLNTGYQHTRAFLLDE